MDAARWQRVQEIFTAALERPAGERRAFVAAAAGADAPLAAEVWSLLEEDARDDSPLDRGMAEAAGALLGDGPAVPGGGTLGKYRLVSVLGEGGMGVVYRATRDDVGATVAIKVLRHAWTSPLRRARFADEQRILARLDHPGIARLFDADITADGTPWFAMELVEGEPIAADARRRGLSIPDRLARFRAACEAVRHAHAHLVLHRDLKPSNILVKADGQVKLVDFGISKQLEADAGATPDPTLTGMRLMTPAYAAPEQMAGGPQGTHTDVYALGVVLYELLAGRLPFDVSAATPAEVARLVRETTPVRPSVAAGGAGATRAEWADLDVLCLTATHRDPARRYATVDALVRDLDRFARAQPLDARPDSISYRVGTFARRHRRAIAAAIVVAAAAGAVSSAYALRLRSARAAAAAEAARTTRIQRFMVSLFDGGDDVAGPADELRVVTLIDRGAAEARALDAEPVVQADLYRTLGGLYRKLGRFDDADAQLGLALERQRTVLGPGHPQVAETLADLALLRVDQAKLDDADRIAREAVAIAGAVPAAAGDLVAARATAALGQVQEARGDYAAAAASGRAAADRFAAVDPGGAEHTAALGQIADALYYSGDYDGADRLNQQVLAAARAVYGDRHPRVADVLVNLGASQNDRGRYAEAEAYYRQALDVFEAFYGRDHFRTASGMTMLGRSLVYQKKFDEAVPLLERALAVQERTNGPVHPRVASALNDLGSVALQTRRLDEAEGRFRRMLEIYRAVYGGAHYLPGIAISNLASVLTEKGQLGDAERLYREAIAIYSSTQSPAHLNTAIGRVKLGRVLLRQKRYGEAETEVLAGYEILKSQASPSVSWLRSARQDLVSIYEAIGARDKAEQFRRELNGGGGHH